MVQRLPEVSLMLPGPSWRLQARAGGLWTRGCPTVENPSNTMESPSNLHGISIESPSNIHRISMESPSTPKRAGSLYRYQMVGFRRSKLQVSRPESSDRGLDCGSRISRMLDRRRVSDLYCRTRLLDHPRYRCVDCKNTYLARSQYIEDSEYDELCKIDKARTAELRKYGRRANHAEAPVVERKGPRHYVNCSIVQQPTSPGTIGS